MAEFDQDTRVERIDDRRFGAEVDAGWNIGANPNGGYLLSLVSAAIAEAVEHPDPLSFTAHYLRPGVPGAPCEIAVDLVRAGRTLSTVRATLTQEGKARVEVIAAYGDLGLAVGVDSDITLAMPSLPPVEACVPRTGAMQGIDIPMLDKLHVRMHPDQARPGAAGIPEVSGWIRFADDREPDTRALLLFCDTFPPSPFGQLGLIGWVPTIELTVHVRRRPAPGWLVGRFRTDDLEDGRMIETGALWDSTGRLVAQCRQIGLVLQND
ncbi:MAG TPA: thioesterase family protein [Pseudomonadales bacterium]|nr:thioesterase family protein [Pseudomonadales bacterium]